MDYVRPADVAKAMVETGSRKLTLSISDLLVRGMLSGAILGVATSLAFNASFTTGQPLVGALIFPGASNSSPAALHWCRCRGSGARPPRPR
jgi:formate transporter